MNLTIPYREFIDQGLKMIVFFHLLRVIVLPLQVRLKWGAVNNPAEIKPNEPAQVMLGREKPGAAPAYWIGWLKNEIDS